MYIYLRYQLLARLHKYLKRNCAHHYIRNLNDNWTRSLANVLLKREEGRVGFPLQNSPRQCGWHYAARVRNRWWAWLQVLSAPDTGLPEPSRRRPCLSSQRALAPLLPDPLCRQLHRNRALYIFLSLSLSLSFSLSGQLTLNKSGICLFNCFHLFICHHYVVIHFIHWYLYTQS